ncbi:hypothetical protein [Kaistia sp. UC242_56]|uniref:hypothetical protein n=1 Tax=Kaistia sp. UC242_56 TaxID=3374625 RepID=UPI0037AFEFD9
MGKVLVAMLAAMIAMPSMASAAVIRASETDGCRLELSGKIEAGDLTQLQALAKIFDLTGLSDSGEASNRDEEALCLDSPGGQYVEGRALAHFVHENGIATRLLPGAECYSACAVVFMAGRLVGGEEDYPSRTMHITAKLGFHAPYFNYSASETFSGDKVNETVILNNLLLADFIAFGSTTSGFQYRPMFPVSLITAMLSATPNEFEMVDSLDKAARWGIGLEGIAERGIVGLQGVQLACENFQAWAIDASALSENYGTQLKGSPVARGPDRRHSRPRHRHADDAAALPARRQRRRVTARDAARNSD